MSVTNPDATRIGRRQRGISQRRLAVGVVYVGSSVLPTCIDR
jgi:hypothetical protein